MSTTESQGQSDGPADPPPGNGAPRADRSEYGPPREDEVSLLDILLVLARHKTLIVRTVLVFTLLGVTYALLALEQYTLSTKIVRETQAEGDGLPSRGTNLSWAASGLIPPAAFPEGLQRQEM